MHPGVVSNHGYQVLASLKNSPSSMSQKNHDIVTSLEKSKENRVTCLLMAKRDDVHLI